MRLLIIGSGENSHQAFHILKHSATIEVVGFIDDDPARHGCPHLGRSILGGSDDLERIRDQHRVDAALVAIGDNTARERLTARVRRVGLELGRAIHPSAIIDSSAHIGHGVIIEMGVCIHPEATIGDGVFLGGSAVVAHHSSVGDFALIAGGVIFGGSVHVGARALVGVGTSIQPHVRIGRDSIVGVGSAVIKDIPDGVIAAGVPAKILRHREPST